MKNKLYTTLGMMVLLIVWIGLSLAVNDNLILPTIDHTLVRLYQLLQDVETYHIILNTCLGLLVILLIGFIISFILAFGSYKSLSFKAIISPFLSFLKVVPLPALIIFFLTHQSRSFVSYLLTGFMVIPLMHDILYSHLVTINQDILDEVKLYSSLNMGVIYKLYLPLMRVGILSAFLQAFGIGLKVKVMTEFITNAPKTIGYQIAIAGSSYSTDLVFAWSALLIVVVVLVDLAIHSLLKKSQLDL